MDAPAKTTRRGTTGMSERSVLEVTGGTPLRGRVRVGGSKNAALPMLAAALLPTGTTVLRRVPELTDTRGMIGLLRGLGANVTRGGGTVAVDPDAIASAGALVEPDPAGVGAMRGAVCLLGPLLGRAALAGGGAVRLAKVGGCDLGPRPIDRHLAGFAALGAAVERRGDGVTVSVDRLRGAELNLAAPPAAGLPAVPSVTGTINLLCAAAVAEGVSVLHGAAREPEVAAVGRLLIAAGARIAGLGTDVLTVTGVQTLRGVRNAAPATVAPGDRIEAATWMIAAAATGGRVVIDGVAPSDVAAVADVLRDADASVTTCGSGLNRSIRVVAGDRPRSFEARSAAFPGLPTDVLPQLAALAALADGTSVLTDEVFPGRTAHLAPLARFGGTVERAGAAAVLTGGPTRGAEVSAPDLRAAASLLIAALAAEGTSRIAGADLLLRGYERPAAKLRSLGAVVGSVGRANEPTGDRPGVRRGRRGWRSTPAGRILADVRTAPPETVPCSAAA